MEKKNETSLSSLFFVASERSKNHQNCVLCEWFVSNSIETFQRSLKLHEITAAPFYIIERQSNVQGKTRRPFYKHDHNLMDPDLSQFPSESKSGMATWTGVQLNSGKRRPSLLLTNIKMDEQSVRSCHNSPAFFHKCAWHTLAQTYTNPHKAQHSMRDLPNRSEYSDQSPVESNSARRCDPMATDRRLWSPEPGRKGGKGAGRQDAEVLCKVPKSRKFRNSYFGDACFDLFKCFPVNMLFGPPAPRSQGVINTSGFVWSVMCLCLQSLCKMFHVGGQVAPQRFCPKNRWCQTCFALKEGCKLVQVRV